MGSPLITQTTLKEYVHYDPLTGVFTQIKKTHPRDNTRPLGEPLGYPDGGGHIHFSMLGRKYKAHRLAWLYMTGVWPSEQIDHIDGDRANNAFSNLREATNAQNQHNRRCVGSASGFKGVYPNSSRAGSWVAQFNKKHLGVFETAQEAADAYDAYVLTVCGEFAATNRSIHDG